MTASETPAKATVIILTYNDWPTVERAIRSALEQTLTAIDVIIVDNGSTDSTWQNLQRFTQDERVRLVRVPYNIRSGATQDISDAVKTEYLSFLFSDDAYARERLERAVSILDANADAHYVFFNNKYVDENNEEIEKIPNTQFCSDVSFLNRYQHLRHFLFVGTSLHPCGMVVRTSTFNKLGGFRPYLHRIGDATFFAKLLVNYDGVFCREAMQSITVWTTGRNESHTNAYNSEQIQAERAALLDEFMAPAMLKIMHRIFPETAAFRLEDKTEAVALWTLGVKLLTIPVADIRLIAFRCLFAAAEKKDPELAAAVAMTTGRTIGEYIATLAYAPGIPAAAHGLRGWAKHKNSIRKRVAKVRLLFDELFAKPA